MTTKAQPTDRRGGPPAADWPGRVLVAAAVLAVGAVGACGSDVSVDLNDYSMTRAAPDSQVGIVGMPVAVPPGVQIRNRRGIGVPEVPIAFFPSAGAGGAVFPDSVMTDADGVARLTSWTLGPTPGDYEVTAQVSYEDNSAELTFQAAASSGVPAAIIAGSQTSQTATAGQAVGRPPEVVVIDAIGLGVEGVPVQFLVDPGSGSVTPIELLTDENGRAAVDSWVISPLVGATSRVRASVPNMELEGSPVVFTAMGTTGPVGGGPRRILWTSDWSSQTGNARSALLDGNRWVQKECKAGDGTDIRVVNADATLPGLPADWPTNLLETDVGPTTCESVSVPGGRWDEPAVGDTLWFRVLAWTNTCPLGWAPVHNVQSNIGTIAWTVTEDMCSGSSGSQTGFKSYLLGGGRQWVGATLPDSTALRYEWGLIRKSTTHFGALVRVYDDASNTLIFDERTLTLDVDPGLTLAEFNDISGFDYRSIGSAVAFTYAMIGSQGVAIASSRRGAYYYGGYAVCNPGPCGRYEAGEGR